MQCYNPSEVGMAPVNQCETEIFIPSSDPKTFLGRKQVEIFLTSQTRESCVSSDQIDISS